RAGDLFSVLRVGLVPGGRGGQGGECGARGRATLVPVRTGLGEEARSWATGCGCPPRSATGWLIFATATRPAGRLAGQALAALAEEGEGLRAPLVCPAGRP